MPGSRSLRPIGAHAAAVRKQEVRTEVNLRLPAGPPGAALWECASPQGVRTGSNAGPSEHVGERVARHSVRERRSDIGPFVSVFVGALVRKSIDDPLLNDISRFRIRE